MTVATPWMWAYLFSMIKGETEVVWNGGWWKSWVLHCSEGQPDLVIHFFSSIAGKPSSCVCQIGAAASCGKLWVFSTSIVVLTNAHSVGHQQNGPNPLSRGANGSNWTETGATTYKQSCNGLVMVWKQQHATVWSPRTSKNGTAEGKRQSKLSELFGNCAFFSENSWGSPTCMTHHGPHPCKWNSSLKWKVLGRTVHQLHREAFIMLAPNCIEQSHSGISNPWVWNQCGQGLEVV